MKPLNALIIDDEPLAHKVILRYAEDVPFLNIVGQVYEATAAYAVLQQNHIDLLFLDINMPKLKGLDFLRTLAQRPQVIVTSAYEEYALEGYELQVCDYLLKPFRFERFLRAVHQAQQRRAGSKVPVPPAETAAANQIFLKVDKQYHQLDINDILYLESYGNFVKVWTGSEFLLTTRTLSSLVEELPTDDFLKIHKSFVVRKDKVSYLEGNQLMMANGQALPIGTLQREAVREWVKR